MSYKNDLLQFQHKNKCGLCGHCSYYEKEKCLHEDHPMNKKSTQKFPERTIFHNPSDTLQRRQPARNSEKPISHHTIITGLPRPYKGII